MTFDAHNNFAYSTVATAPSPASSGTSLVVHAGDGALFPAAPFNATVWPVGVQPLTTNAEIVRVTNVSTDTLTIVRAQESSSARSIVVGDQIAVTITKKVITDIEAATVGGAAQSVAKVYSSATQTVANNPVPPVALTFNTVESDPDGYWSSGHNTRLTIPAGLGGFPVLILGGTFVPTNVGVDVLVQIWKNGAVMRGGIHTSLGTNIAQPQGYMMPEPVIDPSPADGDYYEMRVYLDQGAGSSSMTFGHASAIDAQSWLGIIRLTGAAGTPGATGATGAAGSNGTNGVQGGAVTIPYTFSTTTTDSDPGNGNLRLSNATQNAATVIRTDLLASDGTDWSAVLATLADSSNPSVKGHIRLFKSTDPTKWLLFDVSSIASPSGYKNITVVNVGSSASSPFSNGDAITLCFDRAGDQGSSGATSAIPLDGWADDTAETWTYASGSGGGTATFTVAGDVTTKYTPGTRIKLTQTTVKYFVVASSSFSSGTTTVTITAGSDYTLANAAISANFHSYVGNPQGYPGWFNFAPATTGVTSAGGVARFCVNGRAVVVALNVTGTSNSTTKQVTLPITPANISGLQWIGPITVKNNGTILSTPGECVITNNTAAADLYKDTAAAAWTNSGAWFAIGEAHYEI